MGAHTDTKEKTKDEVVKRQLDIPSTIYKAADDFVGDENNRLKLYSGKEKLYLKEVLPILIGFGVSFTKGEVYTPDDRKKELMKDDKFVKLLAKAQVAMSEFKKYQDELLAK